MNSTSNILAEIEAITRSNNDLFGVRRTPLITALPFEDAKPWLKSDVKKEKWEAERYQSEDEVLKDMANYLPFAFDKALNQRGFLFDFSENRSIDLYLGLSFLLSDDTLYKEIVAKYENYDDYGIEILEYIRDYLEADLTSKGWGDNEE